MDQEKKIKLNEMIRKSRQEAKMNSCVYCGKKTTKLCYSHTVPKFILNKINDNGMIYNSNAYNHLGMLDVLKKENGVGEAGTFRMICQDCDSRIFQEYEDETKISQQPTNKIMTEIALKNVLKIWSKRNIEICLYNEIQNMAPFTPYYDIAAHHNMINDIDLAEIKQDFKRCRTILEKNLKSGMKLMFWHKCNYVVPLAFQGPICLYGDLNGLIINNIYDYSTDLVMQYIHICVFPLEKESVIMIFYHKDDTNYKAFERQFNKLNIEDKLRLISFIIFNYSEDFFVSKNANDSLKNNPLLYVTMENNCNILADDIDDLKKQEIQKAHELQNYKDFPNLLGSEFAIFK